MPPKSSSLGWPRRGIVRTTARNSVSFVLPECASIPTSSASPSSSSSRDSHLTPPPPSASSTSTTTSAAAATSLEFSQDDSGLFSSPEMKSALQAKNYSPSESSNTVLRGEALIPVCPNKINVGDETQEERIANSNNLNAELGIRPTNSIPADVQEVKDQAGDENIVGTGKAAVDGAGARIVVEGGKKKVVRRVKVIKKVLKRVMKKVPKVNLGSAETERVGDDGNLNENIQNLENKLNASQSMLIENVDPMGIDSVKHEKFESDDVAPLGVENNGSKDIKVDSMEVENVGSFAQHVSPIRISSEVPFADDNDGNGGDGIQNEIKNDKDSGDFVEDQNAVSVEQGASELGEVQNQSENNRDSVDLVEDQNAVLMEEGASEVEEVMKEFGESNGAGLSGGVAVSGEMEPLERKRRWKAEIFLDGLDKDAKEEDIRKVFEHVGEVTEVRLVMNGKTGKNKGFAFVRFASAADAAKALAKYSKVEICGKQCGAQPVEGNDTLYLGKINKNWKEDDVIRLLKDVGIEKIDKVMVKANPKKIEQNRGFALVEFETSKDAQIAYNKLQKNDAFNKQLKIKVAWAQPLVEPDEEKGLKVNVKVSLANPQKKAKQMKHVLFSTRKEPLQDEPKTSQSILKVHGHGNKGIHASGSHEFSSDRTNSTTVELIHLLRQQQASGRPIQAGSSDLNYHHFLTGSKRTFHELDDYPISEDIRRFLHTRQESYPLAGNPSSFSHHIGRVPLPYSQQRNSGYTFESSHGIPINPPHFQWREQPTSFGHNRVCRKW